MKIFQITQQVVCFSHIDGVKLSPIFNVFKFCVFKKSQISVYWSIQVFVN